MELIENLKILDVILSIWAIETKRKLGFGGISGKGQFSKRERVQIVFLWNKNDGEVI